MQLIVGGCRGSHPVMRPDFARYGGDTTAFLVEGTRGERIMIDLGTGVRALGARLQQHHTDDHRLLVLLSHYHLDHTMGLPAFPILYDPLWHVTLAAPRLGTQKVNAVIPRLLQPPFWPLQMENLGANITFRTLSAASAGKPLSHGHLRVRWCPQQHPGGSTAYRIEEGRQALVIATDVEWGRASAAQRAALHGLCAAPFPATLLVMDGQFSTRTYPGHEGWGHSTWQEGVALARATGVQRLLVSHHAPDQDDRAMDRRAAAITRAWRQASTARAGKVYRL